MAEPNSTTLTTTAPPKVEAIDPLSVIRLVLGILTTISNGLAVYAIYKIVRPTRGVLATRPETSGSSLFSRSSNSFSSYSRTSRRKPSQQTLLTRYTLDESDTTIATQRLSNDSPLASLNETRRHSDYSRKQNLAFRRASLKTCSKPREITPNLRYVLCLAFNEFFYGIVVIMRSIKGLLPVGYDDIETSCFYLIVDALENSCNCITLLTLSTISMDLYFGVVHWRWYFDWFMPESFTVKWLTGLVTFSCALGFSQCYFWPFLRFADDRDLAYCTKYYDYNLFQGRYMTFGVLIFATIFILVVNSISIFYTSKIYRNISRQGANRIPCFSKPKREEHKFLRNRYMKGLATTFLMVTLFLLTFLPSFFAKGLFKRKCFEYKICIDLQRYCDCLPQISSILNPILYAFRDPQVRESFFVNFCGFCNRIIPGCCPGPTLDEPRMSGRSNSKRYQQMILHNESIACTSLSSSINYDDSNRPSPPNETDVSRDSRKSRVKFRMDTIDEHHETPLLSDPITPMFVAPSYKNTYL